MQFFKKFDTQEEYDSCLSNNEIIFPNVSLVSNKLHYNPIDHLSLVPLYIEAIEELSVSFSLNPIEYSLDNNTWVELPVDTSTPVIQPNEKIYFRAKGLSAGSANGIGGFFITGKCNIGGNAMSMIWGDEFRQHDTMPLEHNLRKLFFEQSNVINAERMIVASKNVTQYGCAGMFIRAHGIVKGCKLPATIISPYAYDSMYRSASNLEIGSDLPATDLTGARYCYNGMYAYCPKMRHLKSMILTPEPNNTNNWGAQTGNWLLDVASEGVFVKNINAAWDITGPHGVPEGWTVKFAYV